MGEKWQLVVKGWKEGGWGRWGDEEDEGMRQRSEGSRSLVIKGERLPAEVVGVGEEEEEGGYREQSE